MKLARIVFAAGLAFSLATVAQAQSASNNGRTGRDRTQDRGSRDTKRNDKRDPSRPLIPSETPAPVAPPAPMVVPKAGPPSGALGSVVNPNPILGGGLIAAALGTLAGLVLRRRRTVA